jgi:hypothetical protein
MDEECLIECNFCEKTYKTERWFVDHMKKKHPGKKIIPKVAPMECEIQTYINPRVLSIDYSDRRGKVTPHVPQIEYNGRLASAIHRALPIEYDDRQALMTTRGFPIENDERRESMASHVLPIEYNGRRASLIHRALPIEYDDRQALMTTRGFPIENDERRESMESHVLPIEYNGRRASLIHRALPIEYDDRQAGMVTRGLPIEYNDCRKTNIMHRSLPFDHDLQAKPLSRGLTSEKERRTGRSIITECHPDQPGRLNEYESRTLRPQLRTKLARDNTPPLIEFSDEPVVVLRESRNSREAQQDFKSSFSSIELMNSHIAGLENILSSLGELSLRSKV